ncbi:UNKNOWN [Stylonychia lemnae]|uniref:Uncharacterized protein n=1 Tax=Stylonychia lemnae TaxID=5949 RepID=A0A078B6X2_STYLE|nr:UNKNOWN [Stylonychia lemnae]|eukprot:CDW89936.1 UNKNOWN [Stylonychia lemnae]
MSDQKALKQNDTPGSSLNQSRIPKDKLVQVFGFSSLQQRDIFQKELIPYLNKTMKNSQELIVDMSDNEIFLIDQLDDEVLKKTYTFIKENDKFKNVSVQNQKLDSFSRRISFNNDRTETFNTQVSSVEQSQIYLQTSKSDLRKRTMDASQNDQILATYHEQEIYEEKGITQDRRRRALKNKDYEILREDEITAKVETFRSSIKVWLNQQKVQKKNPWLRMSKPNQNNFFERIQNPHLIPLLFSVFILLLMIIR